MHNTCYDPFSLLICCACVYEGIIIVISGEKITKNVPFFGLLENLSEDHVERESEKNIQDIANQLRDSLGGPQNKNKFKRQNKVC